MDTAVLDQLLDWSSRPWFRLGNTDITLLRVVGLVAILFFFWWFASLLERSLRQMARAGNMVKFSDSAIFALTRIVRYLVWILGSIVGLAYLGFDLASLAIVGGAMSVGIGFGLQNIFSNLVSGILILVEKTLKLGDFVDLQSGVVGKVTEIGLRYTRVTTNDNVDVIVPNSEFINGRVTNWTLDDHLRRIHVSFGVAYGSDKNVVRDAVTAAARQVSGTIDQPGRAPEVWLVNFGDSSLDFELVVWVSHDLAISPGRTHARYLWEIETALAAAGIEIPFPQRDLHVRSGRLTVDLAGGLPPASAGPESVVR
ncbi:MAG: mechanosensitive ion channel [Candidatus Accumulibacter sp.]|uniref:mechanosensitive ion channel family protein n=1 Tax=Accumulibacter sp. TaxID=2053492 RepID=UPI001D52A110|nr:mechanosensitive ion channel domain-containing protein [Accumulibacter sp.]MCB1943022.1 mechanosensitive ion channel [Accumulibacter sp.]MCP5248423.1 mechanosensitive ion channel [Accumulibacter sp.]